MIKVAKLCKLGNKTFKTKFYFLMYILSHVYERPGVKAFQCKCFLKRIVLTFPIYFPKIFRICQTSWKPLRIKSFWITSNVTCFHDAKVERKTFSSSIFQVNHDDQIVSSILLIILVKTANEDCQMFLI